MVCFVPNEDLRLQALQAGAVMAGGHELIMEISKGKVCILVVESLLPFCAWFFPGCKVHIF